MRGTYEAFILVEVKGGRKYVCALNRRQRVARGDNDNQESVKRKIMLEQEVIWN